MAGGFDAGSVRVSLGFILDDRELKVYDREYSAAKAKPDVKTGVKFDYDRRAYEKFMRDRQEMDRMRPVHLQVKVDVDQRGLQGASQGLRAAGDAAEGARLSVGSFSAGVSSMATLAAAASPILLALGGAVTALAGSLAAAVGGAAALGTGLGAVFMPVATLAVGVVTRLTAITKVWQAQQQATLADQTKAGQATQKQTAATSGLATAMDSLANAHVGVIDARHALTAAENDYGRAVTDAKSKIQTARDAEVKAAGDVTTAQQRLAQARIDATRAQQDAQRAAEDAALSQEDAIARRDQLQAAGQTTGRDYFDAQRQVEQATTDANRAQQDNQAYARKGAMAFQPLVDALKTVADATQTYHTRQKELATLESAGVSRAPTVVAALDRIRLAREAVTRSVQAQNAAERGVTAAKATVNAPAGFDTGQAKAGALLGGLDATEQGLLGVATRIMAAFRKATQGGVDAIFAGITSGLKRLPGAMQALTPDFTRLGQTLGSITQNFLNHLTGPEWIQAWHQFAQAANPILGDMARVFTDAFDVLRDIALAVLPDLKRVFSDMADMADRFAGNVHKALGDGSLQRIVHSLVGSFRDWVSLIGQVGLLLVSVFRGGKQDGDSMVTGLTQIVKHWREWIDKNPEKVRQFFKDARDLIGNIAKVIGPVAAGFIAFISKAMEAASKISPGWLRLLGATFAAIAVARFTGAIKLLELMGGLVGKKLPGMPGVGNQPGSGGGGRTGGVTPGTVEGGPTGGAADPRGRAGRLAYGENFRYGAPTSELGQVRGGGLGGAGRVAGVAGIAAIAAQFVIPPNSQLGKLLNGSPLPANSATARGAISTQLSGITGHDVGDSLKDINKAIDELVAGGDSSKVGRLAKGLHDVYQANKGGDVFDPSMLEAYSQALSKTAGDLQRHQAAQEKWRQTVQKTTTDASDRWRLLQSDTHASVSAMEKTVDANAKEIRQTLGTNTQAGASALNANFQQAVAWVQQHMTRAGKLTAAGMTEIDRLLASEFKTLGISPKEAKGLGLSASDLAATTGAGQTVAQNIANLAQSHGMAGGGWIGHAGEAGGDQVPIVVGRGEAVLNRHQQGPVEAALRATFGISLGDLFSKVTRPHYMAAGGFVQAPGTNYSVGQEPELVRRLTRLARALGLHLIGLSGYRSPAHSVEVGGFPNDPHTRGEASDTPGIEGVAERVLERFGLTRPFGGAAEADHIQLFGGGGGTRGPLPVMGAAARAWKNIRRVKFPAGMGAMTAIGQTVLDKARAAGNRLGRQAAGAGPSGGPGGGGGTSGANQALGKRMMLAMGWPASQWPALKALWTRESGWNQNARNPSSGAYGIPQALGHGNVYGSNPRDQIAWGLNYIKGRYGSPAAAWAHETSAGWYASGGFVGGKTSGRTTPAKGVIGTVPFANMVADVWGGADTSYKKLLGTVDTPPAAYTALAKSVTTLGTQYSLEDRRLGQVQSPLVNPDTGEVDPKAIAERIGHLNLMRKIREQIVSKIQAMVAMIPRIIGAYREAIRRLKLVLPYASKSTANALKGTIASYNTTIGQWSDTLSGLTGDTLPNAQLDVTDVDNQIAGINGTQGTSGSGSGGADLSAQLAQLQSRLDTATASAQINQQAVLAFGSPGDIGTSNYANAYNAAADRPAAGSSDSAGSGGAQVVINQNIQTLHPGTPQLLVAVANAAVAGIDYQSISTAPRETLGV